MQRRVITAVVAIAVVIGALSLFFIFYPTEKRITIVSINDLHGALLTEDKGGIVQIAGYVEELRKQNPNTIVIDVGDAFQGRPISNLFYGESVIECYNAMGVDCLAVGNHEFDWGVDVLKDLMDGADFPFLSANVVYDDLFEPYIIKNVDGVNIQIIGLTTELTPGITEKKRIEGFQFTDAGEAIKNNYNESCDVVVIAGHMGAEDESSEGFIALKASGVTADIFLGGHTHEGANWRYDNCTFMEAYAYGTAIGVVNLTMDRNSEIVDVSSEVINVTPDYESETVSDIVNEYYSMVEGEMERVIAYSPSQLRRNSDGESALGNWVCDIMRQAFDADVALTNSGGIRADLEPGDVTVGDVFSIMPFDNTVALVELTGSQLREALEIGIATDESGELLHGIVQVSGLNFTYDDEVMAVYVEGRPLKNDEKYLVATNSFMAGGGDGYYIFEEGNNLIDTGVLVRDLLLQYAESSGKIEARVEGRIRMI